MMEILTGPKGGKYWLDEEGKKHYIKKSSESTKCINSSKRNKKDGRNNSRNSLSKTWKEPSILSQNNVNKRYCCVCGKELSISDMNYYDLTDYCPKCALADGIITSLD